MTFGNRLRRLRKALKLTQAQIAAKTGVSRPQITQWENGHNPDISANNLYSLADFLDVRGRWLLTGIGPKALKLNRESMEIAGLYERLSSEDRAAVKKHLELLAATSTPESADVRTLRRRESDSK